MNPAKILVIDDEPGIRDLLTRELTAQGHWVESATDGLDALEKMKKEKYQVALCDLNMPKLGGLEALEEIHKRDPEIEVIMMTGYATVETAVDAMKKGAYDFVQKPFNLNEVLALVEKSIEKSDLKSIVQQLREAKKKLEETQMQLIQSEKLAGIGQLAAGVAHELNNPLSGVMGFAQLLLDDPGLTPQQRKDIETICAQSQRCRVIIQNLLQFSRRKEPVTEPVSLAPLLQTTIDLVKYDFSTSGIDLIQHVPTSLPSVFGDPNQLQQVFLNLITNARQAMESQKNGRLLIEASQNGKYVVIRFSDNGPGIPLDIQGKIFDPFFTTKPQGKGTGLGLSICYGILQQHQGHLKMESTAGEGATFIMELPIYEK
jgi:two-component system, NtrC family, sensor kinase